MATTPLMRDARPEDAYALRDVTLSAYAEYAASMGEHWQEYRLNIIETVAGAMPMDKIVAELDGTIVGSVLLFHAGAETAAPNGDPFVFPAPEVRLLAVAPEARGRGVGAALMRECIRRARASGSSVLTLHTTEIMKVAMQMYEGLGFVRAPELDFHPVPEFTIMGYRIDLSGDPAEN